MSGISFRFEIYPLDPSGTESRHRISFSNFDVFKDRPLNCAAIKASTQLQRTTLWIVWVTSCRPRPKI